MDEKDQRSPELEVKLGNIRIWMKETVSIIVVLIGLIAGVATIIVGNLNPSIKSSVKETTKDLLKSVIMKETKSYRKDLEFLANRIEQTDALIKGLNKVPEEAKIAAQLNQQKNALKSLSERLGKMEKAVLDNPAKALEMPLLRKDFDHLKKSYETDSIALRYEVSRIYDLNKWFIGLMFSMAIGIIGLAITNFIKAPNKDNG